MPQPPNDLIAPPSDLVDPQAKGATASPLGEESSTLGGIASKAFSMTPPGQAWPTIKKGMEYVDKNLYDFGGWATDKGSKAGLPPQAAAALGVAANVGPSALLSMGGGAAGSRLAPMVGNKARDLMQSALKPSVTAQKAGKGDRAIRTLLEGDANVSRAGIEKLNQEIDKLEQAVTAALQGSNATVDKVRALLPIRDVIQQYRMQATPQADLATIRRVAQQFLDNPVIRGIRDIPIQAAQEIKRGTYKQTGDAGFGRGLRPASERDSLKGVARGLREGIEQQVPQVAPMNARMGDLANARNLVERRVAVEGNRDPLGLGALAHNPLGFLAWMGNRYGAGKSALARGMYQNREVLPRGAGQVAGATAGAESGRPEDD